MKRLTFAAGVVALATAPLLGAGNVTVRGTYVEARTAEVFTGGCIMNAEAGTTGREALLAWHVDKGAFNGVALDGLSVVAAVAGDVNLGVKEIGGEEATTRTALFVDSRGTSAQRAALAAMATQFSNGLVDKVVEVTPVAIQFSEDGKAVRFSAAAARLVVQKSMTHDPTCGGKQWFHPFASVTGADMGTAEENAFSGQSLGSKWSDPNKHSAFFGQFGN